MDSFNAFPERLNFIDRKFIEVSIKMSFMDNFEEMAVKDGNVLIKLIMSISMMVYWLSRKSQVVTTHTLVRHWRHCNWR